jgi:hypothetical protein
MIASINSNRYAVRAFLQVTTQSKNKELRLRFADIRMNFVVINTSVGFG